jgi:hypothetical protein
MPPSGIWCCVVWQIFSDVSEDRFSETAEVYTTLHDITFQDIGILIVTPESPNLTF